MSLAFGRPASSGYVPSRIGTAPFSPAQEIKSFSRREKSDRNKLTQTPAGRARTINNTASENPGSAKLVSCSGNTSQPSSTNIKICIIQANPSLKRKIAGRYTSSELPAMIAMMYTARKPLPSSSAVSAYTTVAQASDRIGYNPELCIRTRLMIATTALPATSPTTQPMPVCCTKNSPRLQRLVCGAVNN